MHSSTCSRMRLLDSSLVSRWCSDVQQCKTARGKWWFPVFAADEFVVLPVRPLAFLVAVPSPLATATFHERSWVEVLIDTAAVKAAGVTALALLHHSKERGGIPRSMHVSWLTISIMTEGGEKLCLAWVTKAEIPKWQAVSRITFSLVCRLAKVGHVLRGNLHTCSHHYCPKYDSRIFAVERVFLLTVIFKQLIADGVDMITKLLAAHGRWVWSIAQVGHVV